MATFHKKTFGYFEAARRNEQNRGWFTEHKQEYERFVAEPFTALIDAVGARLSPLTPGIVYSAKKLAKPVLRQMGDGGPALRTKATAFFSEPKSSLFEDNPGIYLSLGAEEDDNVAGVGIYQPSSRQLGWLRPAYLRDHAELRRILGEKALVKHWGGLSGDRYQRFPKDFDETAPGAEYLWQKQIFLSRHVRREEVVEEGFIADLVESLAAAALFLQWVRGTVGLYKKPAKSA